MKMIKLNEVQKFLFDARDTPVLRVAQGESFRIECPRGSGRLMNLGQVAAELSQRLGRLFLLDEHGRRPIYGSNRKLQEDPNFRDYLQFHEYFHGDTGEGVGASHQTGWTALVAKLLQQSGV